MATLCCQIGDNMIIRVWNAAGWAAPAVTLIALCAGAVIYHTERALIPSGGACCPLVTNGIVFNVTSPYAAGLANAATLRPLCDTSGILVREGVAAEESVILQWSKSWGGC